MRWTEPQELLRYPLAVVLLVVLLLYPLAVVLLVVLLLCPLAVVLLVVRICAEKLQTRKQRDEKAKGRESKRTRKQKDEKSRLREAAEKQNAGWAKPQTSEVYLLLVVGLMVEIGSEKLNRVRRRD